MSRPRLLALRALGLGDLLTAVPALRALAAAFPDHRRLLACPGQLGPLAQLTGAVDEVVPVRPLEPLDERLGGVEVAVNLHGRGPESHRILRALEPGRLIAFYCPAAGHLSGPTWRAKEHEVARWCRLLEESGIPADPLALRIDPPPAAVPDRLCGATLIHPGAAAPARRWPAERFAAVARAEAAAGRTVVITGGPGELELAARVATLADIPEELVAAGTTDLPTLTALVACAGRVVCGDTGVSHLATATGTPSVVLHGPVAPAAWGPPADDSLHRALWRGRTGDPHGAAVDPGLLEISVEDVLAALAALPEREDAGALAGGAR